MLLCLMPSVILFFNPLLSHHLKGAVSAPFLRKNTLFSKLKGTETDLFIHLWFNRRYVESAGMI